ncbi:hypothetical protein D6C90_09098 [Aureobasidium pullulans]|uniref:Uncharacterized protein n=1 Tax=Aureobasidium pullulans TaxID=5580 RepID=A0A4S9EK28_AURPU|nr:hypothetical protein D6D12_00896 [Aureobasidium pullulans]THX49840.1 hypothetical protein D6D08_09918 [Aureobasidium pullulans]THZ26163.1 hypothetical protein D6C90_09098 [Aureobasidium pullulans]
MADTDPANKNPRAATVEDHPDTDDEKGDSSASKPASNSASKRARKSSKTSSSKTRPASNVGQSKPPPPEVKDPPRPSEEPASRAGARDEVSSEPGARPHKSRRHSQLPPPISPGKVPKEQRTRSPERRPHEHHHPDSCRECASAARHGHPRPRISPLQQHEQRANTFPMRPKYGPPPVVSHGLPPPGHIPPPVYLVPSGMRTAYPPAGGFPGGHPPPHSGPAFDPRAQGMRSAMAPPPQPHLRMYPPSQVSMPPSLPGIGGPTSPIKTTARPASEIHHSRNASSSSSKPQFSSAKITQYDTFSAAYHPDDEEHVSARNLPSKPHHVPGGFESDSYSSESPPESPEYYEQSSRPYPLQRATTSAVQQIHRTGHARSRSDYPAESSYGYRPAYPSDPGWDPYPQRAYPDHDDRRAYPGGRRGSGASNWTHQTSASDPVHPGYIQYAPPENRGSYRTSEDAANMYMNQARGHPEVRETVETLNQRSNGPRSARSTHSHRRSQHSMSETSSRHRGAEGSVKLIMPISAVEGTKIQLSGDMGDREVSFRPTNDPGQVEVTIGTVNGGERRYLKSGSQSSRPTRSSGSTRHATRGGAEGLEQAREHREHTERREHRR